MRLRRFLFSPLSSGTRLTTVYHPHPTGAAMSYPVRSDLPAPPFIYSETLNRRCARRSIDIAIAMLCLLLLIPVLLLAAFAILLEDGRPVLFTQHRVGRFERLFTIYKFRTMYRHRCGDALTPSSSADSRLTRVGRLLRKTSIDELPQLFNVIRGDMSLVGPRPEMPFITRSYENWQHLRHLAPPGITGIWQTTCRSLVPLESPEATKIDLDYIRRASPALDVALLMRTVIAVMHTRGAC